jgi:hypothetical protein
MKTFHNEKESAAMILASALFDQPTLTLMRDHDPVVQRYRQNALSLLLTVLPGQRLMKQKEVELEEK